MYPIKTTLLCAAVLTGAAAFASSSKVAAPSDTRPLAQAPAAVAAEETVTLKVTGMT